MEQSRSLDSTLDVSETQGHRIYKLNANSLDRPASIPTLVFKSRSVRSALALARSLPRLRCTHLDQVSHKITWLKPQMKTSENFGFYCQCAVTCNVVEESSSFIHSSWDSHNGIVCNTDNSLYPTSVYSDLYILDIEPLVLCLIYTDRVQLG
jgi:hypothetical protein